MKLIDRLTTDASQQMTLVTDANDTVPLGLRFLPRQQLWRFNIAYKSFSDNGNILQCSPNILRQYKNNIPFGIACTSTDSLGPLYLDDFTTGRIKLYLLTADEVQQIETLLFT